MITGAIVGGIGSLITKGVSIFQEKQNQKHEIKLLEMQLAAKKEETESEKAISEMEAYASMRNASYQHDTNIGQASLWVVNTQKLVRPVLTTLALIALVIFWFIEPMLRYAITTAVIELASTAFVWWFGDRSLRKWSKSNG